MVLTGMAMLLLVVVFGGAIGFLIGYFLGRRSAGRERQAGFPVIPTIPESPRSPGPRP